MSLVLCLTLTLYAFGAFAPDADATSATIYTFGNPDGPFRDLAKEAEQEQRKKDKKKVSLEREQREKFARMKAQRRN